MTLFNDNYKTSVFSGIYKVLTVASEFKQGQFTQTLDLIRIPYQADYDYVYPPKPAVDERASDLQPQFISSATTNTAALSIGTPPKATADDAAQLFKRPPLNEVSGQLGSLQSRAQQELAKINNLAPTKLIGRTT
jgi:hypothetical protein